MEERLAPCQEVTVRVHPFAPFKTQTMGKFVNLQTQFLSRIRCSKRMYFTKAQAEQALESCDKKGRKKGAKRYRREKRWYFCRKCRHYHLTSQKFKKSIDSETIQSKIET